MTRPTDLRSANAADARALAVARARLAGRRSRRAAGRRRRNVLNLGLLAVTVIIWVLGLTTAMSAWWALVPLAVSVASLTMSRRADLAAAGRDRADRADLDALEERLHVTARRGTSRTDVGRTDVGRPVVGRARPAARSVPAHGASRAPLALPSGAEGHGTAQGATASRSERTPRGSSAAGTPISTDEPVANEDRESRAVARTGSVAVTAPESADAPRSGGSRAVQETGAGWVPAAVPAPIYALKANAAPRTVAPYQVSSTSAAGVPARPTEATHAGAPLGSPVREQLDREKERQEVPAPIDLDSVLARRRAAGA